MILTSNKSTSIYTYIEDIIIRNMIDNDLKNRGYLLNKIKHDILKLNDLDININIKLNIENLEIEFYIPFNNAILYIRTLFEEDDDVHFIHYTDLVYVTDSDGVIRHDLRNMLKIN